MARCPSSVCLSVCKLFCANHFYYETNGWIVTKLAHDSLQVSAHPGCAQGRGQSLKGHAIRALYDVTKIASSHGQCLDCDQTCTRWSPWALSVALAPDEQWMHCLPGASKHRWNWTCPRWAYCEFALWVLQQLTIHIPVVKQFVNSLSNCLLYSTVSHSVSTCTHFMKHH